MGLGSSYLMDFLLPVPACCSARGNRNWESAGKGFHLGWENQQLCPNGPKGRAAGLSSMDDDPNPPVGE
jgi:hypothetical protein